MNLFELLQKELKINTKELYKVIPTASITFHLEMAWDELGHRKKAEEIATKHKSGVANKKGLVGSYAKSAMLEVPWINLEFHKDDTERKLLQKDMIQNMLCRIDVIKENNIKIDKKESPNTKLITLNNIIEMMLGRKYSSINNEKDLEIFDKMPESKYYTFEDFQKNLYAQASNYLNKTITLNKKNEGYPDFSFDINIFKDVFLYSNIKVVYPTEFEKTGKTHLFMK